ncbi:hypothetical protein M5C90_19870 [Pseudomonas chlororaphis subsp. piscium]|nr:hypothetical protein M5C90_19870 [Pseudomonas chlororaphis subsp. piscium]
MSRYLLITLAGALTGLCAAPASAALDGGGSYLMQGFYTTPGVLPPAAGVYRAAGSGAGKQALLNNDSLALAPGSPSGSPWITPAANPGWAPPSSTTTVASTRRRGPCPARRQTGAR